MSHGMRRLYRHLVPRVLEPLRPRAWRWSPTTTTTRSARPSSRLIKMAGWCGANPIRLTANPSAQRPRTSPVTPASSRSPTSASNTSAPAGTTLVSAASSPSTPPGSIPRTRRASTAMPMPTTIRMGLWIRMEERQQFPTGRFLIRAWQGGVTVWGMAVLIVHRLPLVPQFRVLRRLAAETVVPSLARRLQRAQARSRRRHRLSSAKA